MQLHIEDSHDHAQMASKDIRPNPMHIASIFEIRMLGLLNSLGMTSIIATYKNVPLASALNAAPPLLSDTCQCTSKQACKKSFVNFCEVVFGIHERYLEFIMENYWMKLRKVEYVMTRF